jgi:hypothetical protein
MLRRVPAFLRATSRCVASQRFHAGFSTGATEPGEFLGCLKSATDLHAVLENELQSASGRDYNDAARHLSQVAPLIEQVEKVLLNELLLIELDEMSKEESSDADEGMAALAEEGTCTNDEKQPLTAFSL